MVKGRWSTPSGRQRFRRIRDRLLTLEGRRLAQRFASGEITERGLANAMRAIPRRMERVLGPQKTWPAEVLR